MLQNPDEDGYGDFLVEDMYASFMDRMVRLQAVAWEVESTFLGVKGQQTRSLVA